MWATAIANYKRNFPGAVAISRRLEDICPKELRREVGEVDVLLTSPECTNHSCAKGAAERSEESKDTALQTIRFAKEFRPQWVVLENVVTMRPWSRYNELKLELEALGYSVVESVLDASQFGVPQSRRRLFLICRLGGSFELDLSSRKKRKNAASILDPEGTWKTTPLRREGRARGTLERADRAIAEIGKSEPFLIVYYGSDGSGGWQPLDRPLRTITTLDRFALVVPTTRGHQMRMLQVTELRRAMGYPANYNFVKGSRRDRIKMLGNGVCPPVMKSIISSLG